MKNSDNNSDLSPQKTVRVPGMNGCFSGSFPGNAIFASNKSLDRAGQTVFLSSEAFHDFSTIFPRFVSRNTRNHHVSQCMKNGDLSSKMAVAAGIEPTTCSLGESRSIQLSYATASEFLQGNRPNQNKSVIRVCRLYRQRAADLRFLLPVCSGFRASIYYSAVSAKNQV